MASAVIPEQLRIKRYAGISDEWLPFVVTLHVLEDRGWSMEEIHKALGSAAHEPDADVDAALLRLLQMSSPEERRERAARRRMSA